LEAIIKFNIFRCSNKT